MAVNPRGSDLKQLLAEETDPPSPCVMLNLLKFKEGGRASYEEYVSKFPPFAERYGASVIYVGDCSTPLAVPDAGFDWDVLLVVQYPNRQAFTDMVADPEYQQITGLRTAALDAAVLQATIPWAA
ncbi:MAG: DUF1330 domain-containing protein [Solirubrobacteraceae bacterium]|nr:DUF1330 domain-containing protein [Solirubrobacteraceae bacterium]